MWTETQSVTTSNGIFQVSLGSVNQTLGAVNFNSDSMYLGIKVGADAEMTPRIRFSGVPYAFNADKLNGVTATQSATGFSLAGGTSSVSTIAFTTTAGVLTLQPGVTEGLTIQSNGANGLTFDTGGAAAVQIGTTNATGITLGTVTTLAANKALIITGGAGSPVSTNGTVWYDTIANKFKIVENGVVKIVCNTTDAGCGAGGGGVSNWTLDALNGVLRPNNNSADFLLGGTSTASAKFAFGGFNSGTPTATFSGDLIINNKPNTAVADMQKWTKLTGTAGTIGGNNTLIASISAATIYNGSLYVGTNKADQAEVYRYDGPGLGTWTKVSGTAGTIGGGATTLIDMVSSMIIYNGKMYVGTTELDKAEVYRYDGGTTWTKVSGAAGTFATTTLIDGVPSMVVHGGRLYIGTKEGAKAEFYRYNGGTSWTVMNTTARTFVTTNSAAVNAVSSMVSWNGALYLGLMKTGDADIVRMNSVGVSTFISLNAVGATGSYAIDGTAVTGFNDVPAMTIWNGRLVAGLAKVNSAEIIEYTGPGGNTNDAWARLGSAAGTITTGGTASIDSIGSLAVYGGRLYAGTIEPNAAEILRFDEKGSWTKVSQNTAGMLAGGGTGSIDGISVLLNYNHNSLFAGTLEPSSAEGYSYVVSIDQSYALRFHAIDTQAGGEQNGQPNLASIFFVASLSANVNNKSGNTGAFVFSHSIITNNGSYDVAEDYPTRDDTLESGDVVSIDPNERGFVKKSEGVYDYSVIGVYSENPAMRLSQDDGEIDGGRAVPIALAGRVPIKVSNENGEVKSGDYLTSSSVPGVAMKAKKSGIVIGQAMEDLACIETNCVGKVLAYVKSSSYQGSIAANFVGLDTTAANSGEQILAALHDQHAGLTIMDSKSEIVTDRLVAGLEIVAPRIVTDELIAKKIKADQIEGLAELIAASSSAITTPNLMLESLNVDGLATISANLRVKNNTLIEGFLNVVDTIMSKNLIINGLATFFGDTLFKGNVVFAGHTAFSKDMVGTAVVKKDSTSVDVNFEKEYDQTPVVNANIVLDDIANIEVEQKIFVSDLKYVVTKRTTKGFTIILSKPAISDITFSWIALGVDGSFLTPTPMSTPSPTPDPSQKSGEEVIDYDRNIRPPASGD